MKCRRTTTRAVAVSLAALASVGSLSGCSLFGSNEHTLTAHFSRTVGLYKASDVRILGVKVGKVTAIEPDGTSVKVTMQYDPKFKIPAGAQALVVAPSIVSDRYVQLTPTYATGMPEMANGADIPQNRTAVPVELDQIYASLDTLNQALGPNGANKNGALSNAIKVGADNLAGNGAQLNTTLDNFSQAVQTLANQRDDLFGTVRNLQVFTTTLANSDQTVRTFNKDLADVSAQLDGEKADLASAVRNLSVALSDVATFVRVNKANLTANVKDLASVTSVLVKQKKALEEFLDTAPTALSNLQLAYNPASGTLDTRADMTGDNTPTSPLCPLLSAVPLPVPVPGCTPGAASPAPSLPAVPPVPGAPALPGAPAALVPGTGATARSSANHGGASIQPAAASARVDAGFSALLAGAR